MSKIPDHTQAVIEVIRKKAEKEDARVARERIVDSECAKEREQLIIQVLNKMEALGFPERRSMIIHGKPLLYVGKANYDHWTEYVFYITTDGSVYDPPGCDSYCISESFLNGEKTEHNQRIESAYKDFLQNAV